MQIECRISSLLEYYAEMQPILCKDYASERNESLLSNCRAQLILCKDLFWLSSYLVWVGVKFSNAKEEELLINDASQIGSKKFDFSIE